MAAAETVTNIQHRQCASLQRCARVPPCVSSGLAAERTDTVSEVAVESDAERGQALET